MASPVPGSPRPPLPSLEESIRNSHLSTSRAEKVLCELLNRLTGHGEPDDSTEPSFGLLSDADGLAARLKALADLAERVSSKVADSAIASPTIARDFAQIGRRNLDASPRI